MSKYTLKIPFALPGLNQCIDKNRSSYYAGSNLKKSVEGEIIKCIITQLGGVKLAAPVIMDYLWVEKNRTRDLDNIAFAKKFIQDALVKAGTLDNDGWNFIAGFTDKFTVDKHNPGVIVVITEVEKTNTSKQKHKGRS